MKWYLLGWKRIYEFSGRTRRREYWTFTLINFLLLATIWFALFMGSDALAILNGDPRPESAGEPLLIAAIFLWLLGTLSCKVRRLHDIGKSGYWYLISIVPLGPLVFLAFTLQDSEPGGNEWGPSPKYQESTVERG
jgi:uncharacterized membrane protein YhaH (DUF805 family)